MNDKKDKTISEWMKIFSAIYSEADSKRTPEQIWIAIMAHASTIGESIRTVSFEKLLNSATHTFCWLCSFINKCNTLQDDIFSLNESLCGTVSLKYPTVCGHCKQNKCICDATQMDKEDNKPADYLELLGIRERFIKSYEDYSISNCLDMFKFTYGGRIHIQTLENIGFHFLEEVGEAAVAVRKLSQLRKVTSDASTKIDKAFLNQITTIEGIVKNYQKHVPKGLKIDYPSREPEMIQSRVVEAKTALVVEIGDTFSWFCAILNKLYEIMDTILDNPDIKLPPIEEKLVQEYIDAEGKPKCPTCNVLPCNCAFFSEEKNPKE